MPVVNRFADLAPAITEWRRDIHSHPEVLFDTHRTSALVAEKLRAFGCDEVVEGLGRTGVVGVIRGRESGSGKVIGLRADMDALPILEATGLAYASRTPGAMHACGHDGHTAMLLGAAQYLAETRNFDGTAVVIFQPAEEGGGGGREMVEDGMMERFGIQEVYGMHNMPGRPVGDFAIRPGGMMAAADLFTIHVTGRGGHAAQPHNTVDPVVAASAIVLGLQAIVARNVDPLGSAVISVTSFRTGSDAFNVIPGEVELRGTARSLDPAVQDLIEGRMQALVAGTAAAYGAEARLEYVRNYPVTRNSPGPDGVRGAGGGRGGRRAPGRRGRAAGDGGGGFLVHAERATGRLHLRRQRRHREASSSGIRLQRRSDPGRLFLLGAAGGDSDAGLTGPGWCVKLW